MSVINKDQEILNAGRQNVLKDVDAPLRDQIPAKLLKKLKDMNIGQKVVDLWALGNANRAVWLERQQEYLSDWDEFLVATGYGAFKGSSNLHIPMPFIVAKTMH